MVYGFEENRLKFKIRDSKSMIGLKEKFPPSFFNLSFLFLMLFDLYLQVSHVSSENYIESRHGETVRPPFPK